MEINEWNIDETNTIISSKGKVTLCIKQTFLVINVYFKNSLPQVTHKNMKRRLNNKGLIWKTWNYPESISLKMCASLWICAIENKLAQTWGGHYFKHLVAFGVWKGTLWKSFSLIWLIWAQQQEFVKVFTHNFVYWDFTSVLLGDLMKPNAERHRVIVTLHECERLFTLCTRVNKAWNILDIL